MLLGHFRKRLPGAVQGGETLETLLDSDAALLLGLGSHAETAQDAELYTGSFLAGADLSEISTELAEWVTETRERLAGAARLAAIRAAEVAGSPAEAGQWAERAAAIADAPPLEQGDLQRLLRLALPGSLLEAELRREQAEFTQASVPTDFQRPDQLLLGRERELASLLLSLSDPAVRLLEITGSGGVGKSTLASALLQEQADLSGVQVLSIPLETALASSEAAARVVVALNLQVTDLGDGWLALARAWGDRALLLLLDGAEALSDLGRGAATLLSHCPNVRVIVTSRVQRMNGAVHLALDGLNVPSAGESPERVARSAAVQLFVRGARRYMPRFALDVQSAPQVSAIVRRLDGHPLATVLSATWMRVYPPDRIHTLILQDLADLRAESGSSERHQLSAVFERSWHLLTFEEAQAIAALAVFQGFTPAAALSVAGVTSALLESLSTHSLLRELNSDPSGQRRLEVPPVLAAQAQAHLTDAVAVQDAHAEYYLEYLMTHAPESEEVNTERANIVAAVGYSVGQGRDVSAQIDALLASYDRRGLLDSGTDAFHALKEALLDEDSESAGSILVGLAWLANQSSRRSDAENIAASVMKRADVFSNVVQMKAINIMALSMINRNDASGSIVLFEKALEISIWIGDVQRQLMYSLNISASKRIIGDYTGSIEIVNGILERHGLVMTPGTKMLAEGYAVYTYYYSAFLKSEDIKKLFESFLNKYETQNMSRTYMVTKIIYINLLLDIESLKEAELAIEELAMILEVARTLDIILAHRISRIRLLYRQYRKIKARAEALAVFQIIHAQGDEDGLCEWLLACAPDLLDSNLPLGVDALRLVTDVLPRSRFQADRAASLLGRAGVQLTDTLSDRRETLNRVEMFLRLHQPVP
ncbi:ATP-binding protein [Deinococcus sp. UYEF24]